MIALYTKLYSNEYQLIQLHINDRRAHYGELKKMDAANLENRKLALCGKCVVVIIFNEPGLKCNKLNHEKNCLKLSLVGSVVG